MSYRHPNNSRNNRNYDNRRDERGGRNDNNYNSMQPRQNGSQRGNGRSNTGCRHGGRNGDRQGMPASRSYDSNYFGNNRCGGGAGGRSNNNIGSSSSSSSPLPQNNRWRDYQRRPVNDSRRDWRQGGRRHSHRGGSHPNGRNGGHQGARGRAVVRHGDSRPATAFRTSRGQAHSHSVRPSNDNATAPATVTRVIQDSAPIAPINAPDALMADVDDAMGSPPTIPSPAPAPVPVLAHVTVPTSISSPVPVSNHDNPTPGPIQTDVSVPGRFLELLRSSGRMPNVEPSSSYLQGNCDSFLPELLPGKTVNDIIATGIKCHELWEFLHDPSKYGRNMSVLWLNRKCLLEATSSQNTGTYPMYPGFYVGFGYEDPFSQWEPSKELGVIHIGFRIRADESATEGDLNIAFDLMSYFGSCGKFEFDFNYVSLHQHQALVRLPRLGLLKAERITNVCLSIPLTADFVDALVTFGKTNYRMKLELCASPDSPKSCFKRLVAANLPFVKEISFHGEAKFFLSLGAGLPHNKRLETLWYFFDEGPLPWVKVNLSAFSRYLRSNSGLKNLAIYDLECPSMREWNSICDAVKEHSTLMYLSLVVCARELVDNEHVEVTSITPVEMIARATRMATALRENEILQQCDFESAGLDAAIYESSIKPLLERNIILERLRELQAVELESERRALLLDILLQEETKKNVSHIFMYLRANADILSKVPSEILAIQEDRERVREQSFFLELERLRQQFF